MQFKIISRDKVFKVTWISLSVLLLAFQLLQKQTLDFAGIVGLRSKEITTNASARVKSVFVIPGQVVKRGTPLLELDNPQLDLEINRIASDLAHYIEQKNLFSSLIGTSQLKSSQIEGLKKQLAILQKQKEALYITSDSNGKVEAILKKEGENVQPHFPIMTLLEENPNLIRGYIHESVIGEVLVGMDVLVSNPHSLERKQIKGKVLSFGSSIVPFPERLSKDPSRAVWGREVLIEVGGNNNLILGQKVFVMKDNSKFSLFNVAQARDEKAK
jgi:multidrug resistance efflux pump